MVEAWLPQVHLGLTDSSALHEVRARLHRLIGQLASLQALLDLGHGQFATRVRMCTGQLKQLVNAMRLHLDHEEILISPLLHRYTDLPSAIPIMRAVWDHSGTHQSRLIIPWLLNHLPDHSQRLAFIDCYALSAVDALGIIARWLRGGLDPFLYRQLCVDFPQIDTGEQLPYAKLR